MQRFLMLLIVVPLLTIFLQACHPKKNNDVHINSNNPLINHQVGALFLAKNKLKPGVFVLPSGLQYFIVKYGLGDHPTQDDLVTIYYQGQFVDGTTFDNKYYQNEPVTVPVASLIPGWQEAIKLMRPGSIWVLYVPHELAFKDKGVPGIIGPNQTLIFTVHLIAIHKKPTS